jgi:hypothetical protein
MVDVKNNPNASHYTIKPIRVVTDQQQTIFDPLKLQTFIIELGGQLDLLRKDFNIIKDTFFQGDIPTPNTYGLIIEDIVAKTDTDDLGSNHSVRKTESSELVTIQPTPVSSVKSEVQTTKQQLQQGLSDAEFRRQQTEQSIESQIQRGQSNDSQNQTYLSQKIVELQKQIKDIQNQ